MDGLVQGAPVRTVFLTGTILLSACLSLLLTIVGIEYVNLFTDLATIVLLE